MQDVNPPSMRLRGVGILVILVSIELTTLGLEGKPFLQSASHTGHSRLPIDLPAAHKLPDNRNDHECGKIKSQTLSQNTVGEILEQLRHYIAFNL